MSWVPAFASRVAIWCVAAGVPVLVAGQAADDPEVRRYTKSPGAPAPAMTDAAAFPDSCRP